MLSGKLNCILLQPVCHRTEGCLAAEKNCSCKANRTEFRYATALHSSPDGSCRRPVGNDSHSAARIVTFLNDLNLYGNALLQVLNVADDGNVAP